MLPTKLEYLGTQLRWIVFFLVVTRENTALYSERCIFLYMYAHLVRLVYAVSHKFFYISMCLFFLVSVCAREAPFLPSGVYFAVNDKRHSVKAVPLCVVVRDT